MNISLELQVAVELFEGLLLPKLLWLCWLCKS